MSASPLSLSLQAHVETQEPRRDTAMDDTSAEDDTTSAEEKHQQAVDTLVRKVELEDVLLVLYWSKQAGTVDAPHSVSGLTALQTAVSHAQSSRESNLVLQVLLLQADLAAPVQTLEHLTSLAKDAGNDTTLRLLQEWEASGKEEAFVAHDLVFDVGLAEAEKWLDENGYHHGLEDELVDATHDHEVVEQVLGESDGAKAEDGADRSRDATPSDTTTPILDSKLGFASDPQTFGTPSSYPRQDSVHTSTSNPVDHSQAGSTPAASPQAQRSPRRSASVRPSLEARGTSVSSSLPSRPTFQPAPRAYVPALYPPTAVASGFTVKDLHRETTTVDIKAVFVGVLSNHRMINKVVASSTARAKMMHVVLAHPVNAQKIVNALDGNVIHGAQVRVTADFSLELEPSTSTVQRRSSLKCPASMRSRSRSPNRRPSQPSSKSLHLPPGAQAPPRVGASQRELDNWARESWVGRAAADHDGDVSLRRSSLPWRTSRCAYFPPLEGKRVCWGRACDFAHSDAELRNPDGTIKDSRSAQAASRRRRQDQETKNITPARRSESKSGPIVSRSARGPPAARQDSFKNSTFKVSGMARRWLDD